MRSSRAKFSVAVMVVLLVAPAMTSSQPATAQACVAGPSLLLVQTPRVSFAINGFEDDLRVVDSCGVDRGTIDIPSPSIVWPTGKSGVAIVQSDPDPRKYGEETLHLVDAALGTAVELDVPSSSPESTARALFQLSYALNPRYALVGAFGPKGEPNELTEIHLVDLSDASVVDVLDGIPADVIPEGGFSNGWVDDGWVLHAPTDVLILRSNRGGQFIEAPVDDLSSARVSVHDYIGPPRVDLRPGCRTASVLQDGGVLYACDGEEPASIDWRIATAEQPIPADVPELDKFQPHEVRAQWATSWGADHPYLLPVSYWDDLNWSAHWVPFPRNRSPEWVFFRHQDDLPGGGFSNLEDSVVVDVRDGVARPTVGLPSGRGFLRAAGAVGDDRHLLLLWVPFSTQDAELFENWVDTSTQILALGQLYSFDLDTARATFLAASSSGALSPDGAWVATSRTPTIDQDSLLSVGPFGGPLVDIGPGFGTWLTP